MGNCLGNKKPRKLVSEIAPSDTVSAKKQPLPIVFLDGDPTDSRTHYIRFALLFKPISLRFIPSEAPSFTLRFDSCSDSVTGSAKAVLRFVELKLPNPVLFEKEKLLEGEVDGVAVYYVVRMAVLQHLSMTWHLERVARWGKDIEIRSRKTKAGAADAVGDPKVGTLRMEVGKFGKSYGMLLEMLLEHAQMEERLLFTLLQAADPGACRCVTEEHARGLPLMNGIKEDIKSIGVLKAGTANHREALCSLSARLKALQDNCRIHFSEEERNLFPLMEAAHLTRNRQLNVVAQCIDVMEGTHSHLFRFFIEGLLPHQAMEYLDLVMDCVGKEKVASMLRLLVD